MRRSTSSSGLAIAAITLLALATLANAAVLTIGPTAPVVDGEDIANLAPQTGSEKLWTDTRAIGQTFTTGSQDVVLDAITLQSAAGSLATKNYTLTVGAVSGTSYSAVATESGIVQSVDSVAGDYWTFTLDAPLTLSANTLYGFDLAMNSSTTGWGTGIPYRATTGDLYADGQQFRSQVNAQSTPTIGYVGGDKVFHLNMEVPGGAPVVILETDFTDRTVSGKTAGNIAWTTNGVDDPGDLTFVPGAGAPTGTSLFDTANAQGHFAPDINVDNEGPWSVTIPLSVEGPGVVLESVILDWQHFNNSGAFQSVSRPVDWTVSVTGSSSGELDSVVASVSGSSGTETISFTTPLTLTGAESWQLKLNAEGFGGGNNTGLDAITVIGQMAVVPEPSTLALAALGLLGLGWCGRRRRRRA